MKKAVVVGQPQYAGGQTIVPSHDPMIGNPGNLNQTASGENRSKKFEYPAVRQDIPEEGKNQYA